MALYLVGDYIKETRMRKGYTQEEVSFGICTTASLSRIENGLQIPGRFILDKLLERLGIENNVFNSFVSKEEMEFYEIIQDVLRNITDGNLEELELHVEKMEKITENMADVEKQCLYLAKGVLSRRNENEHGETMEWFMKAIHATLPSFDGVTPLKKNLLTFDEIMIINSIAVQHAKENKVIEALKLEFWLKEYMEEKITDGRVKRAKYPIIVFNLSNWLGQIGRYVDALSVADEGISFCTKYGNLISLPFLVFNKACSLAELKQKENAKVCFEQSIAIFSVMKKYDKVKMATDWCEKHYKIEL